MLAIYAMKSTIIEIRFGVFKTKKWQHQELCVNGKSIPFITLNHRL